MLGACPSSVFTWDPATQFPFVVVLRWFLHLKSPRKLESPANRRQPAKQAVPWPDCPLLGCLHPRTPPPLWATLEPSGLAILANQGRFCSFHQNYSCKAHEWRMLVFFFFQACVLLCLGRLSLEILYIVCARVCARV